MNMWKASQRCGLENYEFASRILHAIVFLLERFFDAPWEEIHWKNRRGLVDAFDHWKLEFFREPLARVDGIKKKKKKIEIEISFLWSWSEFLSRGTIFENSVPS